MKYDYLIVGAGLLLFLHMKQRRQGKRCWSLTGVTILEEIFIQKK